MLYIKQRERVHSYGHTDRQTDGQGHDIVTSAMKQIATKNRDKQWLCGPLDCKGFSFI